jgi:two-component system CheB/CheR fusion protein
MNYPYIIAIGASSGGLEEINSFFDYTEKLNASYVIIHHFSKENTSSLVELLSRHSKMLVKNAANNMPIAKNVVYILPENQSVTIDKYDFSIEPLTSGSKNNFNIDLFFDSLATCYKEKAIGVIFSGTGSDGLIGLTAIKDNGGTVIVRNPKTTNYSEVAENAIASGIVDFILEPEMMPVTIQSIISEGHSPIDES